MGDDSRQPDARAADAKREARQKKAFHVFFLGGGAQNKPLFFAEQPILPALQKYC